MTTPNVVPSGDPQFVRQQDQTNASLLSLAGGPRRGNNYTLEGVAITDMRNRAVIVPSIEAVEEVKVQVSTYDAEMGRTGGGVFNTSADPARTRSTAARSRRTGRSGAWANSSSRSSRACAKPDGHFWLYGGSAGGPIVQNRTFFFASTEGYNTLTSRNTVLTLPTALERQGDFSQSRHHHLRSADDEARSEQSGPVHPRSVSGQQDSGGPLESGRAQPDREPAAADERQVDAGAGGR